MKLLRVTSFSKGLIIAFFLCATIYTNTALVDAKQSIVPTLYVPVPNITVNYENQAIAQDAYPVYLEGQRYYLSLDYFVNQYAGKTVVNADTTWVTIGDDRYVFNMKDATATKNDIPIKLIGAPALKHGTVFMSVTNLSRIFDLKVSFDYANSTVNIFKNRSIIAPVAQKTSEQTAFLRLEDVMFSGSNTPANNEYLAKLRAISDMLYTKNIPFHIAWIPRYVNPVEKLDNDLEKNFTMANVDYVYTLDYMLNQGGQLGLHGYTHQSGSSISAAGQDFGKDANNTKETAQAQMDKAKNAADFLRLPYTFFEFPHYAKTDLQTKIAEQNFAYIYQQYDGQSSNIVKTVGTSKYVPTPLDYVYNAYSVDKFLTDKVATCIANKTLGSFFFHPTIESSSITISTAVDNYPAYIYQANSPLQRITDTFLQGGYQFKYITQF